MSIDATRKGGSAILRMGGRLDREWSEQLSHTLEDLLQDGVRSLVIDLSGVTYVSSAATRVLARWQEELAVLRGEVRLTPLSSEVGEMLAMAGWDSRFDAAGGPDSGSALRQSTWYSRSGALTSGQYQMSAAVSEGTLTCHLHGHPDRLEQAPIAPDDCSAVTFPSGTFGLGLGAIGRSYDECRPRFGELIAVAGYTAYFPSDGARMADFLLGGGPVAPSAVLASGLTCEGGFSKLVRFNARPEADAVPLSELAGVCLEAVGGETAGLVIAGETAGLSGARLRRSPAASGASPVRFDLPDVREWLSFAPERTYAGATALIAGVVARKPAGRLRAHLRRLGETGDLYGHLHTAVFSYHPLPQRTVELGDLVKGLFENHELRDVLHVVWDDRGHAGVTESALIRGVGWVAPITQLS
jgi:anti-anti-sigma factor